MIPLTTYITNVSALFEGWKSSHPKMDTEDFYEFLCSPTPEREAFLSAQPVSRTIVNDFVYLCV